MTINKRKKNSRQHGSWTHGWGSKKKHRGAGHRGGRGNAGSGKRGDAKKPSFNANKKYFGKYGFTCHKHKSSVVAINLLDLQSKINMYIENGIAKKENDIYVVDLSAIGVTKLLGNGKVNDKFKVTVSVASKKALEKIKNAGGEIILLSEATTSDETSKEASS